MDESLRKQLMDAEVARRLESYTMQQRADCHEEVLQEAIARVDSTFRVDPVSINLDTIGRPPLPLKPGSPNFKLPKDSVVLEPLLGRDNLE